MISLLAFFIYDINIIFRKILQHVWNLLLSPLTGSCDFETVDICGYIQDSTDTLNFDWIRASGKTASANTGPSFDHTYGTKAGKF